MTTYRDDLEMAQQRVDTLEGELAQLRERNAQIEHDLASPPPAKAPEAPKPRVEPEPVEADAPPGNLAGIVVLASALLVGAMVAAHDAILAKIVMVVGIGFLGVLGMTSRDHKES